MDSFATGIKPDPDGTQQSQPMHVDDEDDFEDTGELELPMQPQEVYLVRVPRRLYERWNSADANKDVCIGKIRRGKTTGKVFHVKGR